MYTAVHQYYHHNTAEVLRGASVASALQRRISERIHLFLQMPPPNLYEKFVARTRPPVSKHHKDVRQDRADHAFLILSRDLVHRHLWILRFREDDGVSPHSIAE